MHQLPVHKKQALVTHSLVIDDGHLVNVTKAAKLVFKIAFLGSDA